VRALLAGDLVRPGIGGNQDGARLDDRLIDREQHIGPDEPGQEIDLVALQHLVGDLAPDIRLELVVAIDDLRRQPADLAAQHREGEVAGILHVLADDAGRAAQGRDKTDLDVVLGLRRQREKDRGSGGGGGKVLFHRSPLDRQVLALTVIEPSL
jgi:hypothetical protein